MLDFVNKTISIDDNGVGIGLESLRDAMTVAKTTKNDNITLGKFGFGMKSACSSLGSHIKIVTATENSDMEYSVDYDEDKWLKDKTSTWKNFEITGMKKTRPWNGTRIQISGIKVAMYSQQSKKLRAKFTQRFEYYIKSDLASILFNNIKCVPQTVVDQIERHDINIPLENGNNITGWIGLDSKRNIGSYGFRLYHNKRMIRAADKFGLSNHPSLSMITGELNLEHIPINYHKTRFSEDSPEYIEAINEFRNNDVVLEILRKARESVPDVKQSIGGNIEDPDAKIKSNLGFDKAKFMLEHAKPFTVPYNNHQVKFVFESSSADNLYSISNVNSDYLITINLKSPVFDVVRNPSFLVGMIWVEVKYIIDNSGHHDEFIGKRNALWAEFIHTASEKSVKRLPSNPIFNHPNSNTLSENLIDVYEVLENFYTNKFQFTALSILDNYLDNAYGVGFYTIITEKMAGVHMRNLLLKHFDEKFAILIQPKHNDILAAIELLHNPQFIIIRERSNLSLSHIATYEKALVDLYREIVK